MHSSQCCRLGSYCLLMLLFRAQQLLGFGIQLFNNNINPYTALSPISPNYKMGQSASQPYYQSVAIVIIILNSISLISLSFVLTIYILNWKKIASFPMRLSFYLCLACFIQNLYVILLNPITIHQIETSNGDNISGYCKFQAILKVTFDLSSIIWTSLIIYSVYASVVHKVVLDSRELLYIGIAFVLPLIAAIIPVFFQMYGDVQYFCWFNSSDQNTVFWLKMGYFFIPLWVLFFLNVALSIKTYLSLRRIELQRRLLTIFQRLMLFPLIMFITGIFATANLIYLQTTGQYLIWLDIAGIVMLSLYGFFNSVAYGFNPLIRERIQICLRGNKHDNNELDTSREEEMSQSSRNTEKIEAELYDIRTTSRPTQLNAMLKK